MNTPQYTPEARHMLKILDESAMGRVVANIEVTENVISADMLEAAIRHTARTVQDAMLLVKPGFMRKVVTIESTPSGGYKRRCVEDVIAGIRNCAFSMGLAGDVMGT